MNLTFRIKYLNTSANKTKITEIVKKSFEMWCWRRMEKNSWTDHVRNEEVLFRVNEQRDILHEIRKRKAKRLVISYVETAF